MRRCKALIYNKMKTVDGVRVPDREAVYGLFHQWGSSYDEFEAGPGNFTVAIIELEDGRVVTTAPEYVRFLPDGEAMPGWEGRRTP